MHPLHRIVFAWSETQTLEIEWDSGGEGPPVEIPGHPFLKEATVETQLDKRGIAGAPPICWRNVEDTLFESLQLRENSEYLVDVTLPADFDAAVAAWKDDPSWPRLVHGLLSRASGSRSRFR